MRKKNYNRIEELIHDDSFIDWVIDPDSNKKWDDWQLLDTKNKKLASKAKKIILGFTIKEEKVEPKDIDLYLKELKNSLKVHSIEDVDNIDKPSNRPSTNSYLGWAASIVFLITAGTLLYLNYFNAGDTTAIYDEVMVEKFVPRGQKLTVTLNDGSTVTLNSESKISYGRDFTNMRKVNLEGEAFFEVVKNPDIPFHIHSGGVITTVLGTSFNIKAYQNEDVVQVVVATGNVKVDYLHSEIVEYLESNEMFHVEKQTETVKKKNVDLKEHISWKSNVIYFKDADFMEISSVLEKWYDVDFIYRNVPDIENFNGTFHGKSLEEVLSGIGFTVGFSFRIEGKTVYIDN